MSETQHFVGELKCTGKTLTEFLEDMEQDIPDCLKDEDDPREIFSWIYDGGDFILCPYDVDGVVYEVTKIKNYEYENIFTAKKLTEDTYSFHVKYYDGGCGFNEAIEIALYSLEKGRE